MTRNQFHTWMDDPSAMDAASSSHLHEVIKRYPYFPVAQMLLAKNLRQENHIDQLKQLQLAAVMAPDRKVLHDYLHDKRKPKVAVLEEEQTVEEPIKETPIVEDAEPKETVTEVALQEEEQPVKIVHLLPDELIPEPIIYQLETADLPERPLHTEESEVVEPEALSFSEWLAFTESGKLDKEPTAEPKKQTPQEKRSTIELIDHFLTQAEEMPKKRAEFFDPQKVAARSSQADFTVVSETLARIYFEQEKYELARSAYESLLLKNPEKSTYFAARLKEIDDKLNSD
ncbi:MAG: hypothetical protein EP314_06050 [Bacteroidetes bacterium]|nr:MAG: hypothetical protein EP314_06050 [Bacteroidota bacterium]